MPVDGHAMRTEIVSDMDQNVVAPVCDDGWPGNCAVQSYASTLVAIRCTETALNSPPVLASALGVRTSDAVVVFDGKIASTTLGVRRVLAAGLGLSGDLLRESRHGKSSR